MSFSVQLQTETKVTRNQTSEEEIMHLFMLNSKIFRQTHGNDVAPPYAALFVHASSITVLASGAHHLGARKATTAGTFGHSFCTRLCFCLSLRLLDLTQLHDPG